MSDRRRGFSTREQLAALAPLLAVWAVGVAALALVLLRDSNGRAELFLDPTNVAGLPWYVGAYAEIGSVLWAIATAAAAFGWMLVGLAGRPEAVRYLRGGTAVCTLLLTDAVLQLHARVIPKLLGVPKLVVVAGYVAAVGIWVLRNRPEIRRTRWQILAAAGLALGASAGIDAVLHARDGFGILLEDAPKFLGILAMATYFSLTTRDIAASVVRRDAASSSDPEQAPPRRLRRVS